VRTRAARPAGWIRDAIAYLDRLDPQGIRPGLERVHEALVRVGHPEERLRIVRVGGTNGKGSVSLLIASALGAAGYRVGLYTSPHLVDVRERIRVDGRCIAPRDLAAAIRRVRRAVERPPEVRLTYFELLTVVALLELVRRRVQIAVLEIGLGGRWDATNVGRAEVAVLTNVELDHTEYLGTTRRAIAAEKVEIASPGGLLVTGVVRGAARRVIEEHCRRRGIELVVPAGFASSSGSEARFRGRPILLNEPSRASRQSYQAGNVRLALRALEALAARGFDLPVAAVTRAFRAARWPGRLDVVSERPRWILDGAHNPHGAQALAAALPGLLDGVRGPRVLVMGALASKSPGLMLRALARVPFDLVVCTAVPGRSAVEPRRLASEAVRLGRRAIAEPRLASALSRARAAAGREGAVVVAGSLYLIGAVMKRRGIEAAITRPELES